MMPGKTATGQTTRQRWSTALTHIEPNRIVLRGYALDELMGRSSFGETIYLLLTGDLPTRSIGRLLEAMLISFVDHGATPPSTLAARNAATTGASDDATRPAYRREHADVSHPATSNRSFTATGTPCSGPREADASASSAAAIADSRAMTVNRLMACCACSIVSTVRPTSASDDVSPDAIRAATEASSPI